MIEWTRPVSPMQSMNISLPEPLTEFVDGEIASGRYSSVSSSTYAN
jgi:Arc/MetJ-type ribon-helix-helix transcriptional regulator